MRTLQQWQTHLWDTCVANNWDKNHLNETFLLFTEEVGELAKALRYHQKLYVEEGRNMPDDAVADEMADVLSYLFELASKLDIDLEQALINKEEKNKKRNWL